VQIEFPLLLGGDPIRLTAYSVEAAIAEKFHVMVVRDLRNSRMKDFYDIWMLSRNCSFKSGRLQNAIHATFARRGTLLPRATPPALTEAFHGDPMHVAQWTAFVRRIGEPQLAHDLAVVAAAVREFILPIIAPGRPDGGLAYWAAGGSWSAH